jgi:NTP pyrophosphatase (non-canonical NTP hydrolase)
MPDVEHYNRLSPEVAELLAVLAEECGEVVQRVGKILRHGVKSVSPYSGVSNKTSLEDELTDILAAVDLLSRLDVIDWQRISDSLVGKFERLSRPGMLHHTTLLSPCPCVLCGSVKDLQKGPTGLGRCLDEQQCMARPGALEKAARLGQVVV